MRKLMLAFIFVALAVSLVFTAAVWAGPCAENAYGLSSLRGDAQYPPGWTSGPVKISAPDEFVYGIIDGAVQPQQFVFLKAKLLNLVAERPIGSGSVTAVARYRKRTDYQPDMSTDPPDEDSVEEGYTSSVSTPVPVSELPTDTPVELTFDFSAQPIPAGITDLFLLVMFEGQIGSPPKTGITFGVKNLNEPKHLTPRNNSDWFLLNYQWEPAQAIHDDPATMDYILDTCGVIVAVNHGVEPRDETRYFGFTENADDDPVWVIHYECMQPGHHGRVIYISGAHNYYTHELWESCPPDDPLKSQELWSFPSEGVVNQTGADGFTNTAIILFRGVVSHQGVSAVGSCPEPEHLYLYRDGLAAKPAVTLDPTSATALAFP